MNNYWEDGTKKTVTFAELSALFKKLQNLKEIKAERIKIKYRSLFEGGFSKIQIGYCGETEFIKKQFFPRELINYLTVNDLALLYDFVGKELDEIGDLEDFFGEFVFDITGEVTHNHYVKTEVCDLTTKTLKISSGED